jgi:Phytanoyl-CoA dioxygenase (PhyH)
VVNKGVKSEEELDAMKKKIEDLKDEYEKACEERDEFKKKAKDAEDDALKAKAKAEEEEDKAKEEKAKNLVKNFVDQGRIAGDDATTAPFIKMGKADYAHLESVLNAIPVNKKAVRFDIKSASKDVKDFYAGHSIAAEVARKQKEQEDAK